MKRIIAETILEMRVAMPTPKAPMWKTRIKTALPTTFITFAIIIIFMTIIYSPLNEIFKLQFLTFTQLLLVILISFISVIWYDFVKLIKRNK